MSAKEHRMTLDAKGMRFGLIASRFNEVVSRRLVDGALDCIVRHSGSESNCEVFWVQGSFEIPFLARCLARLPARQADVFVLARLEGLNHKEIAQLLGCSEKTARVHLHRALRRLARELKIYWE